MDILAVLLLVSFYFAFASTRFITLLRGFYTSWWKGFLLVSALLIPFLLVSLSSPSDTPGEFPINLLKMVAYLLIPGTALVLRHGVKRLSDLLDITAVLGLWLPIEFDWLPAVSARLGSTFTVPIPLLTGIVLGFMLFTVIRPLDRLGYSFRWHSIDIGYALVGLLAFMVVGLPLGMAMGFIRFGLDGFNAGEWAVRLLAIYWLNALPEELLFRGIIQNLVEMRFGVNWWTLVASAVIFGISHINNTTAHHSPPNWPYIMMATLAGLGYGWAWRKSEKITISAITHTLVNFIWSVALLG